MPEPIEGLEIFEADKHAESPMATGIRTSGSIDENPEVKIPEELGFLSSRHAWNFPLAPDMFNRIRPWRSDLNENIVLEDFLGLTMNLVASQENVQLELIAGRLVGLVRFDFGDSSG